MGQSGYGDSKELNQLQGWKIQNGRKEGNEAAHRLARSAWHADHIVIWGENIPDQLAQTIWLDKHNL